MGLKVGKWYNWEQFYYQFLGTNGTYNEIKSNWFTIDSDYNLRENTRISNPSFWNEGKEVPYSEVEQYLPIEERRIQEIVFPIFN